MGREPLVKLKYIKEQNGMFYPTLHISEKGKYNRKNIGLFGRQWRDFMEKKYPQRLSELVTQGRIDEIISQLDEEAKQKKEKLIQDLLKGQPIPMTEDTLELSAHIEMIDKQAEEIILHEVVYQFR